MGGLGLRHSFWGALSLLALLGDFWGVGSPVDVSWDVAERRAWYLWGRFGWGGRIGIRGNCTFEFAIRCAREQRAGVDQGGTMCGAECPKVFHPKSPKADPCSQKHPSVPACAVLQTLPPCSCLPAEPTVPGTVRMPRDGGTWEQ